MKIRRSVILFCAATIVLVVLLIWFGKKPHKTTSREQANATNTEAAGYSMPTVAKRREHAPNDREVQRGSSSTTNGAADAPQTVADDPRRGLAALNDVPILFDGKLEDQFGDPVAGATIAASVRIYNGFKSTVERFTVTSDANGFFHIDHGKGEALGIAPSKDGYVLATTNTYFKYSHMFPDRYAPDSRNPTVIKMWKRQGSEPLTSLDQLYKLRYTREPVNVDLLAGKIVSRGGDIKITVSRSAGVVSAQTLQDWSFKIEAVDGGLIRTDATEARVTYALPVGGYQPDDTFIMSTNAPHKWFGGVHQTYFVQSRSGRVYAKVNFGIAINRNPGDDVLVEFRGAANPKSSRNFEADAPDLNATVVK